MSLSRKEQLEVGVRLGNRIRALRKAFGLTQVEVARAAGLCPPNLNRIEVGKSSLPRVDTLISIAHAMGLRLVDLTEGVDGGVACSSTGVLPKGS
jgi:transcriptional regulator with XRE-family HTH domain